MDHFFFRKIIALWLVFQLFVSTPGGVVLAQELSAEPAPAVIEEVIEEVTVVDDAPQEQQMSSEENFQDDVEEVTPELSGKAEEVSSDVSSDDAATLQDEGMVDGTAEDPQGGLPEDDHGDGNLGGEETSFSEDVQSVEIDQNVQSIDLIEELPEVDFSEVLHLLEIALSEGKVSRDDRSGIITFLQSLRADEAMIQDLLERFPVRKPRDLKRSSLPITSGIIPTELLKKPSKRVSRSAVETESIAVSSPVEFVSDRVLVQVRSQSVAEQWIAEAESRQIEVVVLLHEEQPLLRIDAVDDSTTFDLLQRYVQDPDVLYQEPDYVYRTEAVPNDSTQSFQWHHFNNGGSYAGFSGPAGEDLQSRDAWDIFTGSGEVIVAVIDTGVMYTHPDLQARMWDGSASCVDHNGAPIAGACPYHGYDYFDMDTNPIDETNHGTLVAGSFAAHGNNSVGVAGVNWSGKIMALKTGTADSSALSSSAIVNSVYFAVRNGAKILNMSFTSSGQSTSLTNAISFARDHGVLVLAAAGNNSLDLDLPGQNAYPCETNLDNIICIASTNLQGTLTFLPGPSTSNYGQTAVDIAAPGDRILTTAPVQTDLYVNGFENGVTDVNQFILSGGSGWGLKDGGTNKLLTTHTSGSYGNNESTFAEIDQTFNLNGYQSGTLLFEMSCVTDNAFDVSGFPVDGVAVEFSHDGGITYQEVVSFNGALTILRGQFDVGPNGLPLITIGLSHEDFVDQFRFRFHFFSDSSTTGTGCDIDEVKLRVTNGSTYLYASGTSFATPLTAGLASLIWEYDPSLSYQQVIQRLIDGGETLPALTTTTITGKRINSYRSLALMTDPAVVDLKGFVSDGGAEFSNGGSVATDSPFFSWTAPAAQGIVTGYSYAVDEAPDDIVDIASSSVSLSGLAQGVHTFQVFGINDMGTAGTVSIFTFTVDTIAPEAPTSLQLNANHIVNTVNQFSSVLSGSAAEAALLEYFISDGTTSVTGSQTILAGAFSISPLDLSGLDQGPLSISATLRDEAGNLSGAGTGSASKDTQIASPTQLQLNGGQPINAAAPANVDLTFDTAESGVALYTISNGLDADLTGTIVIAAAGTTTINIDHTNLNDALLTIEVVFTDAADNVAPVAQTTLLKDTQVTSVAQVQLNGGLGVNAANAATTTLTFEAFESGAADYLISDGSAPDVSGTAMVAGAGVISVNGLNLIGLDDGLLSVSVRFSDDVSNEAGETFISVAKDLLVTAATDVQLNGGATILAAHQTAVDLTFQAPEAGSAVYTISDGTDAISDSVSVSGAGITIVVGVNVSSLNDGVLNLSVVFTDNVGNEAAPGTGSVQKDSVIDAPSNVQLNGGSTISSAVQSGVDLTFETTEAGSAVYTISDGTNTVGDSASVSGAGTTTISGVNVNSLSDGTLSLSVVFTDTPGNVSAAGVGSVQKDTTVTPATAVTLNSGAGVNAATVANSTLMFDTVEAGTASYVISNGVVPDVIGSVPVSGAGATSVNNLDLSAFADGPLDLSVVFSDSVGNTAAPGFGTAQKDVIVNAASNIQLNGGTTINASTEASVDLTFETGEAGSATYSISDGVHPALTATIAVAGGPATISALDVRSLDNRTLDLSVIFTDVLGNVAVAGTGTAFKDSEAPQAPQNVQINGGVTINAATAGSVDVTGTVAEAGTLLYAVVDGNGNDINGSLAVVAGAFTVPGLDVSALNDGTLTVYVTLTDASGNTSLDGNTTVLKDVMVQSVINVVLNGGGTINASAQSAVTLDFEAFESGTAQYIISDGTNVLSVSVGVLAAGVVTVPNINVSTFDDGLLNVSVVFTDMAGNAAAAGTSSVQKDARVPQAPQNVQLNDGVTIIQSSQTAVALTGTVDKAGTLTYVFSDGSNPDITGSQAVPVGPFTISGLNVSSLDDGMIHISVRVTDAAGNESLEGTSTVLKDSSIAAATNVQLHGGVTINAVAQTSVDLVFDTSEAGSASYILSGGSSPEVTGTVTVSGAGTTTVSGINVSSLDDGTLSISVVFTDTAGNEAVVAAGSAQKDTQVAVPQNIELNGQVVINEATETTVPLEGEVAEAGTLTYEISDGSETVSATLAVIAGNFSFSGIDVSALADGFLTVRVTMTDIAGNISGAAQITLQKDTVVSDPTGLVINGGQPVTFANETAVSVDFSVPETGTIDYEFTDGVDIVTGSQTLLSTGGQSVSSVDVSSLADGTLTLTIRFRDDAGNSAGDVFDTVFKDTIAIAPTNFVINGNQIINLATQSLVYFRAEFSERGSVDYIFTDGVHTVTGSSVISSVGVATVSNIDLASMNEGTISGSLVFMDELGNVSSTVLGSITKDTLVDSAGQVVLNAGIPIDGASAESVTLSFVVSEVGTAHYVITDENNDFISGTFSVGATGTVTVTGIDVTALANGLLTPSVTFVDLAGNQSLAVLGDSLQKTDQILSDSNGGRRRRLAIAPEQPFIAVSAGGGGGGSSSVLPVTSYGPVLPSVGEALSDEKEIEKDVQSFIELPFEDLSETDDEYEAVRYLYERGIVKGQGNGSRFDSTGTVDWAQALKMLLLMSEQEVPNGITQSPFPEIEVDAWFAPYFSLAKKLGYINGGPTGSVVPWKAMNRAEAVVLAYRILGIRPEGVKQSEFADVEAGVWFSDALHDAVDRDLLLVREEYGQKLLDPIFPLSRGEFVRLIVGLWLSEGEVQ